MKRNLHFLLLLLALPFLSFSQQKSSSIDLPSVVKEQFNTLFPTSKEEIWKRDMGLNYQVSFKNNNSSIIVLFDEFGNVLQKETIMSVFELSKKASQYISGNYPEYKIVRVAKNESGNENYYFVEISKGVKNSLRIIFDMQGNYIKTLYE